MVRLSAALLLSYTRRHKLAFLIKGVYRVNNESLKRVTGPKGKKIELVDAEEYVRAFKKGTLGLQETKITEDKSTETITDGDILPEQPDMQAGKESVDSPVKVGRRRAAVESDEEVFHLTSRISFTNGVKQACLLTKSQPFQNMPKEILELARKFRAEQDEKMLDVIMHSQYYDNTKKRLPRRIDKRNIGWQFPWEIGIPVSRSASILIQDLMKIAQLRCKENPDMLKRKLICKPSIEVSYKRNNDQIEIAATNEYMFVGHQLPPVSPPDAVAQSQEYKLPDMFPIYPTVDLQRAKKRIFKNSGAFDETADRESTNAQIIYRINSSTLSPRTYMAYNIMLTFAVALREAQQRFGEDIIEKKELPEPVTVMNVNASDSILNLIVFQLNTLNLDEDDGIKNFVYHHGGHLFQKDYGEPWNNPGKWKKPPTLKNFNSGLFSLYMGMCEYSYDSKKPEKEVPEMMTQEQPPRKVSWLRQKLGI